MRRFSLLVALIILLSGALEFVAYHVSRPIGDLTFISASIALAACAVRIGMIAKSWPIAMLIAGSTSLTMLALNASFAEFVRNTYLALGENFGQSALYGTVVIIVCSLAILSAISAGFLKLARKSEY